MKKPVMFSLTAAVLATTCALPAQCPAAEISQTAERDSIKVTPTSETTAKVTLSMPHTKGSGITALRFGIKVEPALPGVTFDFTRENASAGDSTAKSNSLLTSSRYHEKGGILNVYVASPGELFDAADEDKDLSWTIGQVKIPQGEGARVFLASDSVDIVYGDKATRIEGRFLDTVYPDGQEYAVVGTPEAEKGQLDEALALWTEVYQAMESQCTETSFDALKKAVEEAQALKADKKASQDAVDRAVKKIRDAISGLEFTSGIDKSELAGLIMDAAEKYTSDQYTPESFSVFQAAIREAETFMDNARASKEDVRRATDNLKAAIQALEKRAVDKETLRESISFADLCLKNKSLYTGDSVSALETVLKKAKAVYDDANSTQHAVDDIVDQLADAVRGLQMIHKDANKDALRELVLKSMSDYTAKDYTDDSYQAFQSALSAAEKVLNNGNAVQAEVEEAQKNLTDAIGALVKKPADKSALQVMVDNWESRYKDHADSFDASTFRALKQAAEAAEDVLKNNKATQDEVDTALQALRNALSNLKPAPTGSNPQEGQGNGNNNQSGNNSQIKEQTGSENGNGNQTGNGEQTGNENGNHTGSGPQTGHDIQQGTGSLPETGNHTGFENSLENKDLSLVDAKASLLRALQDSIVFEEHKTEFTRESYRAFQKALEQAWEVYYDEDADIDIIKDAYRALSQAESGLRFIPLEATETSGTDDSSNDTESRLKDTGTSSIEGNLQPTIMDKLHVKTGDQNRLGIAIGLGILAVAIAIVAALLSRREKGKKGQSKCSAPADSDDSHLSKMEENEEIAQESEQETTGEK